MDEVSDQAKGASESKLLAKYRYDEVGNLDTTVTSNGALPVATSRYGYDALNRLDVMTHRRGLQADGALLSSYDYDVRADGKRKGYDEIVANDQTAATPRVSSRTVAFAYDDAGRLIKEESRDGEGTAYELNWALDKVGNRILETRLKAKDATSTDWMGGSLTRIQSSYSSTGTDWLTLTSSTRGTPNAAATSFVGATTETQSGYGYDPNGSQTRKTTQAGESNTSEGMEWSFEGALLRVEKGENNATKFTYDAGGNRVQALTRDGAKMSAANYLVDENTAYAQVLEERDSSGELQARYVYGQGYGPILLQRRQKNSAGVEEVRARYLLADGHGSVRQLMTASGTVTDSYFYDAWGGGLSGGSGNTVNPYRYNGQQTDEATGGYYLRARYYQPGNGRFLGHDPLLGAEQEPLSLHRYLYAGGDGVNFDDPSGLSWFADVTATIGAMMTLYSKELTVANIGGQIAFGLLFPETANDIAQRTTGPVSLVTSPMAGSARVGAKARLALQNAQARATLIDFIENERQPLVNSFREVFQELAAKVGREMNVSPQRNIALAGYDIAGQVGELVAISGNPRTVPAGKVWSKFVSGLPAQQRILVETLEQSGKDPELKIMEQIAQNFPQDAVGRVLLYSERALCPSCYNVVRTQFKKLYPNITVEVITSQAQRTNIVR